MYYLEPNYPSDDEVIAQYIFECEEYASKYFEGTSDAIQSLLEEIYSHNPNELKIDAAAHYISDIYELDDYIKMGDRIESFLPSKIKAVK